MPWTSLCPGRAHCTKVFQHWEDKFKKLILHFVSFYNLKSLLSCVLDPNDASKVKIQIWGILQCKTVVTTLVKLLPPSHDFLSGSWERCEGGMRDTRCMKSACKPKPPTTTTGCHCSNLAYSSKTAMPDKKGAVPKKGMLLQIRIFLRET
jgi:hypothetical protein